MKKIIFITGIYGVGKSTFCQQVAKKCNFEYIRASDIIYGGLNVEYSKKISGLNEVNKNQDVLLDAIKQISLPNRVVLDGHTCLLTFNNSIEKISIDIFSKLNISDIIVLTRDISCVYKSLIQRDKEEYSMEVLDLLQREELLYSKVIANSIGVNYQELNVGNMSEALKKFERMVLKV